MSEIFLLQQTEYTNDILTYRHVDSAHATENACLLAMDELAKRVAKSLPRATMQRVERDTLLGGKALDSFRFELASAMNEGIRYVVTLEMKVYQVK